VPFSWISPTAGHSSSPAFPVKPNMSLPTPSYERRGLWDVTNGHSFAATQMLNKKRSCADRDSCVKKPKFSQRRVCPAFPESIAEHPEASDSPIFRDEITWHDNQEATCSDPATSEPKTHCMPYPDPFEMQTGCASYHVSSSAKGIHTGVSETNDKTNSQPPISLPHYDWVEAAQLKTLLDIPGRSASSPFSHVSSSVLANASSISPTRSVSAMKAQGPILSVAAQGNILPALNGKSLYYSSRSNQLVMSHTKQHVAQLTNIQNIRRYTSAKGGIDILHPSTIRSNRSFTTMHIQQLLKDLPFSDILRSRSLEDIAFYQSIIQLHDTWDALVEMSKPCHRFRGGKLCSTSSRSLPRAAYPPVNCDQCQQAFGGMDRKHKLARHRKRVHGTNSVTRKPNGNRARPMPHVGFPNTAGDITRYDTPDKIYDSYSSHLAQPPILEPRPTNKVCPLSPSMFSHLIVPPIAICEYCYEVFDALQAKDEHVNAAHIATLPYEMTPFWGKQYPAQCCQQCNKGFMGKYAKEDLQHHIVTLHECSAVEKGLRICKMAYKRAHAKRKHEWKKYRIPDARPKKRTR
jgi:hypothetical protein